MQNRLINYLFTNETVQVLFWTLVHSLWQGIVFAFFTAIILMSTKKSATALRYKLLSSVLILFIITSAFTFCYEVLSIINYNSGAYKPVVAFSSAAVAVNNRSISIIEKLISVLQPYENLIVLIWFTIIIIKCFGLVKGLRDVYILKHRQVFNAGEYWNNRLQILAENSGIKKQIQLLKSAIAKVPMVVGYFKPVILFPAAALTALAPEEIEAILLHELAHIRRKDYLINIFQRIAEIIFFFNPAVLWISSLIEEERENCCDDIAVKQTNNKKQFIHALVSFQEYNVSDYAATFSGRKNFLLDRIKRIVTNNNKTLNNMEKTFLLAGIIITALTAFAFSQHKQSSLNNISALQSAQTVFTTNKKDTVPQTVNNDESKYSMSTSIDGKQYRLVEVNGKVTELYIDNVRVPDNKISEYSSVIDKLQKKLKEDKEAQKEAMAAQKEALKAQAEVMKENQLAMNDEIAKQAENMQAQAKELQEEVMRTKMQNDSGEMKIQTEAIKAQVEIMKQKALALTDEMKAKTAQMQKDAQAQTEYMKQKSELMKDQALKLAEVMKDKDAMIKEQVEKQAGDMKEQAKKLEEIMKEKDAMIKDQAEKQSKLIKEKTEKLINEDLKKQVEELKEQNEELKQQIKQKVDSIYKSNLTKPQGA